MLYAIIIMNLMDKKIVSELWIGIKQINTDVQEGSNSKLCRSSFSCVIDSDFK